jgi:hypothetical protein
MEVLIDGKALGCDSCGRALNVASGFDHVSDLQVETRQGSMYPTRYRDMGQHYYCGPCGQAAPPQKTTYASYPAEVTSGGRNFGVGELGPPARDSTGR